MATVPPFMPPSPASPNKRKASTLDLGNSQLSRPTKAQRSHYGIDIHRLLHNAQIEESMPKVIISDLPTPPAELASSRPVLLWTEKYRAKKFTDLIGDERTHRAVMHWLKRWDKVVFPHSHQPRQKVRGPQENDGYEAPHKKILLLTGSAGLGKTTLAHVCAKQAGYDPQEINASDERSRDVVKGRIKDMVGTENVKYIDTTGKSRKSARPVCVIVDEVDGVVAGSGSGGEGGFIKALIDLIHLDQRTSNGLSSLSQAPSNRKRGERFRLMRPMILICNDIYHPALRPLRQSNLAEIVHMRKPDLSIIATRMHAIFVKEGVSADADGVRRLCEAIWGVSNRKEDRSSAGAGEGDMRSVLVVGEWVASKLRAMRNSDGQAHLTRRFVEDHILADLSHGGSGARGMGRGGSKDIVERIFAEGAGFPKSSVQLGATVQTPSTRTVKGVAESLKRVATDRLRQLVDTSGDTDKILTDVWAAYPTHPFQDDTLMSKPNAAYDWLHFHDCLSSAVFTSNEWELAPYLSTPVVGFHHLFASQTRSWAAKDVVEEEEQHPFYTKAAAWAALEAQKSNELILQTLQDSLSLPLTRLFPAPKDIAVELLPYTLRMLAPGVNPIVISGTAKDKAMVSVRKASEQALVARAVNTMAATGVRFERTKVASEDNSALSSASFIFRMEPALDTLTKFETGGKTFGDATTSKIRFAVRQVLDQEFRKDELKRAETTRMARFTAGMTGEPMDLATLGTGRQSTEDEPAKKVKIVRDFFGRPIAADSIKTVNDTAKKPGRTPESSSSSKGRVWITYHEGFSNAVRKPLTLAELMRDM